MANSHILIGSEGRTTVDLLLGVSEVDIFQIFGQSEAIKGFGTDYRDRILRTFVTNNYRYHLQEILLAITGEYTDWSRPVQNEQIVMNLTAEALHDASSIAPMSSLASRLASANRNIFYYVFSASSGRDLRKEQRKQSITELLYIFGVPLGAHWSFTGQKDYSRSEVVLCEAIINYWTNFVKTGNPNNSGNRRSIQMEKLKYRSSSWPKYDQNFKKYLDIGTSRGKSRDHYRAPKIALWTWLLPNLERVGARYGPDSQFHQLPDSNIPESFSGPIRQWHAIRNVISSPFPISTTHTPPSTSYQTFQDESLKIRPSHISAPLEIPPEKELADFTYTTALTLTVAIGCSLLILNILVFAAVYYRRDPRRESPKPLTATTSIENNQHDLGEKRTSCGSRQYKSSSPSHCGTLCSSATLRSSLANSCDEDVIREWPPDYTSCCQDGTHPTIHNIHNMDHDNCNQDVNTGTSRPHPPARISSVPLHVEAPPLLSPVALLQEKHPSNVTSNEIRL